MSNGIVNVARQLANVVGAIFQALAGVYFVVNLSAEPVADESGATPIDPAAYAFFVWAPILLLCLVYAVYQGLPANRENPLLRRVGWFTAGAFAFNGLWEVAAPLGRLGLAQVLIAIILAFLAVVYLRLVRFGSRELSEADRWLVALPVGIFFGWITAANAVSLTSLAVRSGVVAESFGGVLLGAALLLLGSLAASAMILVGKAGTPQAYLAYGVTVLWALVGIVANQYQASLFTTGVASLCTVLVALVIFGAVRGGRPRPGTGSVVRAGIV